MRERSGRRCEVFERSYFFNPFLMETASDSDLARELNSLAGRYIYEDKTPNEVAFNINLESDMLMIYGEFIARYQKEAEMKKLEANILEAKSTYQLRKDWVATSNEKSPALRYFEAQGEELAKGLRTDQINAESMLTRFKKAYTSLETKQNALKKKLEAMRYEEV